jgi:hypothetical protein
VTVLLRSALVSANTIRLASTTSDGLANIDYLDVA